MIDQPAPPAPLPMGEGSNPLAQLRDIHLPAPISWWPPALGWWLLGAIVLIVVIISAIVFMRRFKQRRYRAFAAKQLRNIYNEWQTQRDDIAFAQAANRLLKQTALTAFSAPEVAALNGADWLDWLDRQVRKPRFTEPDVRALATLYLRAPEPIAVEPLRDAAHYWIRSHRC